MLTCCALTDGEFKGNAPLVNGEDMSRDTSLMNGVEARETVRSFDFSAVADDGGVKPQGTKPWFLQPIPTEVSVHQGEPLTLQCVLDGVPKPVGERKAVAFPVRCDMIITHADSS